VDSITAMGRVVEQTGKIVDGITPEQLSLPTLCTEWSVRDVINHITGGGLMFATCVEQGAMSDEAIGALVTGDNLGDNYRGAFKAAAAKALAAFDAPGAADKPVKLPFGEMPAGVALNIAVFDLLTHAADLARATSQRIDDEELVQTALAVGRQMVGPDLRKPGVFDAEQSIDPGAPAMEKLLAFAGRRL
jgi:uncharacterized protein (TIGR03086 family)